MNLVIKKSENGWIVQKNSWGPDSLCKLFVYVSIEEIAAALPMLLAEPKAEAHKNDCHPPYQEAWDKVTLKPAIHPAMNVDPEMPFKMLDQPTPSASGFP